MNTIKFKSNIKCGGCIAAINEGMNEMVGENQWEVDLSSENRILTVKTENVTSEEISEKLKNLGYTAEKI
ncbi:MAG: heavy-metal-associated domain-containing protein [Bacteroidia bacterium]